MPTPRKSTQEKKLRGTLRKDRDGAKPDDVVASGQIEMPDDLTPDEVAIWSHAVESAPANLLSAIDRSVLRTWVAATCMANTAAATLAREGLDVIAPNNYRQKHPQFDVWKTATATQTKTSQQLGFDPLSRSKVKATIKEPPQRNKFWAFASDQEVRDAIAKGDIHQEDIDELRARGRDV